MSQKFRIFKGNRLVRVGGGERREMMEEWSESVMDGEVDMQEVIFGGVEVGRGVIGETIRLRHGLVSWLDCQRR